MSYIWMFYYDDPEVKLHTISRTILTKFCIWSYWSEINSPKISRNPIYTIFGTLMLNIY